MTQLMHLIHLWLIYAQGGPRFGLKIVCEVYHHHKICTLKV